MVTSKNMGREDFDKGKNVNFMSKKRGKGNLRLIEQ